MVYVLDTSSIITLGHYFPERFPSFWENLDESVASGAIVSVREVYRELDGQATREHLKTWIHQNSSIFRKSSAEEVAFVAKIFSNHHFQQLISKKQTLKAGPVADPFLIAAAHCQNGCVVTEERWKDNAAKIPNVCEAFDVDYCDLEGFLTRNQWAY